jgi:hypothetical protein
MNRRSLIALPLTLALGACVTIERDNTGADGLGCTHGESRCYRGGTADVIERCERGAWVTQKTCGDSEVCLGEGHDCRAGAGSNSCVDIIECVNDDTCLDTVCYENCLYDGTDVAQTAYIGIYSCLETAGCGEIEDPYAFAKCVVDQGCAPAASSCLVGQAGNGTCADITRCLVDDCLPLVGGPAAVLTTCLLECEKLGTAVGQTWFLWLQQCAKVNCLAGNYVSCVTGALNNPDNPCKDFAYECAPDAVVGVPGG